MVIEKDVVALGNIVADFVAAPVKNIPNWGELYQIEQPITLNIGGNAAIFSACASGLGLNSALMGKLGDDELGKLLGGKLRESNIDISHVNLSKESRTSATLVIANEVGERSFFHHFGANREFTLEDIDFEFLNQSKAVLLCSYFIMPGLEGSAAKTILERAKQNGLTTFFDVAWDPTGKWILDDFLKQVDVFIPNDDEISMLTKKHSVPEAASHLIDLGVKTIAVKMGGKGCYIANTDGDTMKLPAHDVKAIDTTGAGDTFNAGFVYGTLSGWDLERTARFANAAAALSVTKIGGTTAAPTSKEVEDFMNRSE